MFEIIDFLESMGSDARLQGATENEIQEALIRAGLPASLGPVMADADRGALESVVGARSNVCCLIYSPDKEDEEEEDEPEEEDEDEKEKDDKVKKSSARVRRAA